MRSNNELSLAVAFILSFSPSASALSNLISTEDINIIAHGGVAVLKDWLPSNLIDAMGRDAYKLFEDGYFIPDGLTNTALSKKNQGFSGRADRQTFRGAGWNDDNVGDVETRIQFANRMNDLRNELAVGLNRPSLAIGDGKGPFPRHEMTYNWYEPGANLGRHLDEHHEETKGAKGWQTKTRRSVTWLVYLNKEWNTNEGGGLRTFPRKDLSSSQVGAHDGNLQIGWIDHIHPVFLDAFRPSGQTALYITTKEKPNDRKARRTYISAIDFDVPRQPIEFSSFLSSKYQNRFEQISTARLDQRFVQGGNNNRSLLPDGNEESFSFEVTPTAGTLVLFDSVSLPHSVNQITGKRQRIAATGWFHEDSQTLPEFSL